MLARHSDDVGGGQAQFETWCEDIHMGAARQVMWGERVRGPPQSGPREHAGIRVCTQTSVAKVAN
jgi:hypothetical protein